MSAENRARPSYWCNPSSLLADTTLVYNASSPINRQASVPASAERSLNTITQQCSAPSSEAVNVNGLQSLGKSLSSATYQRRLQESSCSHGQMGFRNNINYTSSSGLPFCCERLADPYNPPLTTVLDFLVNLHEKGLSYTTINNAQSAISAITLSEDKNTIGCHPLFSRFMKGIYKGSLPTPRYQSTWDVQPVLTYLASINPADKL